MKLKCTTININSSNKEIETDLLNLRSINSDIYCIQEFPKKSLSILYEHFQNYYIAECREDFINYEKYSHSILNDSKSLLQRNIIISKFPIKNHTIISHIPFTKIPIMYRLTLQTHETVIESHYIDIEIQSVVYRIVNTHLECFTSPQFRKQQLHHIISNSIGEHDCNTRLIIAGDFNTFATPLINCVLSPLFDYSLNELFIHEHTLLKNMLEEHSEQYKLEYAFVSSNTLKYLPLNCDGFIISHNAINTYNLYKENPKLTHSDHFCISLDITYNE